jgi:NTE family protein
MTTAVVLSGGGSLGAVQVGMLQALDEAGVVPDLLVGSSVGALNAAFVAGHPGAAGTAELAEIWAGLRRASVFPTSPARVLRALSGRADSLTDSVKLRALLEQRLGYQRLEQAHCPLTVVATELLTGREVVLSAGPAVDAVLASAALPGVFPPVEVEGHLLFDGGVVNNTPISAARDLGADLIYVLPTGYACALERPPRSALGMALHAVTVAIQRRLIEDVRALQDDIALKVVPPLCPVNVSPADFGQTTSLIERARSATLRWLAAPPTVDQTRNIALHSHGRSGR